MVSYAVFQKELCMISTLSTKLRLSWIVDFSRAERDKAICEMEEETWEKFKDKMIACVSVDNFNPLKKTNTCHSMTDPYQRWDRFTMVDWRACGVIDFETMTIFIEIASHKTHEKMKKFLLSFRKRIFNYLLNDCRRLKIWSQKIQFDYWSTVLDENEHILYEDFGVFDLGTIEYDIKII
jgi:hypothetical protein